MRAAEQRALLPLLSKPVLDEYRAVLADGEIVERFPEITPELVQITIRRLRFVGDYVRSPKVRFQLPRDVRDEKFIELALALNATHIVTHDADLLSLTTSVTDAGKRFRQRLPNVEIVTAGELVRKISR